MHKQVDVEEALSPNSHIKHCLVPGTSYVLRVSSLAAASVGLVALAIFSGYSCIWYGRYRVETLCTPQTKLINCLIQRNTTYTTI